MTWLIDPDTSHHSHKKGAGLSLIFALAAAMTLPAGAALAQDNAPATKPATPAAQTQTPATAPAKAEVPSTTELSKRLESINKALNQGVPDVHIALMDRDWITQNMALQQIGPVDLSDQDVAILRNFSDGTWQSLNQILTQIDPDAAARQKLLADFVTARAGVAVDPGRMSILTLMTDPRSAEGFSTPGGAGASAGLDKDQQFCTVFGEFADLDADSMTRMTTGLNNPGLLPNLDGRQLVNVLPLDVLRKAVDYHESGHCWFHAKKGLEANSLDDAVKLQHASETYADITSVLLLAHFDGITNVGDQLANMRLAAAALQAPFIVRKADPRTASYYGVFIHTTEEGLRAAQKEVDRIGAQGMKDMSLDDIRAMAFRILDSLPERGFKDAFAVTAMQQAQFDTSFFDDLRQRKPEYGPAIDYALKLKDEMNKALPKVIDLHDFDKSKTPLEQIQFNFDRHQPTDAEIQAMIEHAQTEYDQTVAMLKDRLVTLAGGPGAATDDSLVKAYDKYVDEMRHTLENGTKDQRTAAMKYLSVIGDALEQAVVQVDGPKPVPKAPATLVLPAPQGVQGLPPGIIMMPGGVPGDNGGMPPPMIIHPSPGVH